MTNFDLLRDQKVQELLDFFLDAEEAEAYFNSYSMEILTLQNVLTIPEIDNTTALLDAIEDEDISLSRFKQLLNDL